MEKQDNMDHAAQILEQLSHRFKKMMDEDGASSQEIADIVKRTKRTVEDWRNPKHKAIMNLVQLAMISRGRNIKAGVIVDESQNLVRPLDAPDSIPLSEKARLVEMLNKFPLNKSDRDEADKFLSDVSAITPSDSTQIDVATEKRHILVVEDAGFTAEYLAKEIETPGKYNVLIVSSGSEALEAAKVHRDDMGDIKFACVILDLNLPDISGEEFMAGLREIENSMPGRTLGQKPIPVIVTTGYPDMSRRLALEKLGVVAFLKKPIDQGAIPELIGRAISKPDDLIKQMKTEIKKAMQKERYG